MKVEVKVPEIGESITEAVVGQWLKEDKSYVEMDEIICELESEKATVEVVAEQAGTLSVNVEGGETVEVGSVIATIDSAAKAQQKSISKDEKEANNQEQLSSDRYEEVIKPKQKVTPLASEISEKEGIGIEDLRGSGVGGKITKNDVVSRINHTQKPSSQVENDKSDQTPQVSIPRGEKREKMSTLRQTISQRMLEAKHSTAMLTTINEVDLSEIKSIRGKYKDSFFEKNQVKLGFMSFFTKACALALEEYPAVNAQIDGDEVVYHNYADIAIAVSTDKGLVVPVIRNAHVLSLAEIEKEIQRLAEKARDNKLKIDEMRGGTFSITNGGVFGSLISTPIINYPQSAILGMHTIQDRPVARDGQVVIRPMMYISLSYDHRTIDGKESVSFLVKVKEILEDPIRMLLNV